MKQSNMFISLPQLETERLVLREMTSDDAEDMFEYASDPEVAKFTGWEPHRLLEDTRRYLQSVKEQNENGESMNWGMELKENNRFIGTCGYTWWNSVDALAEIGYALSRRYWGKGLMTEAVCEVIKFGFKTMKLKKIEAQHMILNEASGRVLQKAGMTYRAVLRKKIHEKDECHDVRLYSILHNEYMY